MTPPPTITISALDALRLTRLNQGMHLLSFLLAPDGKAACCLNCGAVFDDATDAGGPCVPTMEAPR